MSKLKSMSNFFLIGKQKIFNYFFNFSPKLNIMFKKLFFTLFSLSFVIFGCFGCKKKITTISSILISTYDNSKINKDIDPVKEFEQLDKDIVSSLPTDYEPSNYDGCIKCHLPYIDIDSLINNDTLYNFPHFPRDSIKMCCPPPHLGDDQSPIVSNDDMNVNFYKHGKKLEVTKTSIGKNLLSHQLDKDNIPDIMITKYKGKIYAIRFQNQTK